MIFTTKGLYLRSQITKIQNLTYGKYIHFIHREKGDHEHQRIVLNTFSFTPHAPKYHIYFQRGDIHASH